MDDLDEQTTGSVACGTQPEKHIHAINPLMAIGWDDELDSDDWVTKDAMVKRTKQRAEDHVCQVVTFVYQTIISGGMLHGSSDPTQTMESSLTAYVKRQRRYEEPFQAVKEMLVFGKTNELANWKDLMDWWASVWTLGGQPRYECIYSGIRRYMEKRIEEESPEESALTKPAARHVTSTGDAK